MVRSTRSLLFALTLAIVIAPAAAAQEDERPALEPGDVIRVFTHDLDKCWPCEGELRSLRDSTLALQRPGSLDLIRLRLDELERIEVAVTKSRRGNSARNYAIFGGLLGSTIGLTTCAIQDSGECAARVGIGLAAGALVGAGLGAVLGSRQSYTDWEIIPVDALQVSWTTSGVTLGISGSIPLSWGS